MGKKNQTGLDLKSSNGPNIYTASARETPVVPKVQAPDSYGQTMAMRPAAQQDIDIWTRRGK
jgi:hypothetical protein